MVESAEKCDPPFSGRMPCFCEHIKVGASCISLAPTGYKRIFSAPAAFVKNRRKLYTACGAMERETGFEPATFGLGSRRSTAELLPRENFYSIL